MKRNKTIVTKPADIKREWHLVDVSKKPLGRVATQIAQLLMGKDKPYFTRRVDCGDHVVAVNAAEVQLTGKKEEQKVYIRFSGYPSGKKEITFKQMMAKDPRKVVRHAVKGMLPKNKLQAKMLNRLHIFTGEKHDYEDRFK